MNSVPSRTPEPPLVATVLDKPIFTRLVELLAERTLCTLKSDAHEQGRHACLDRIEELERDCLEIFSKIFPSTPMHRVAATDIDNIWLQAHSDTIRVGVTYSTEPNVRRVGWIVLKPELYY